MRVKMKTTMAGPERTLSAGAVADLPDELAKSLCDGGYAEALQVSPGHALAMVTAEGVKEVRSQPLSAADVEIPDDWRQLSAKDMKALADLLIEAPVKTRNEAFSVIEDELKARSAVEQLDLPQDGE